MRQHCVTDLDPYQRGVLRVIKLLALADEATQTRSQAVLSHLLSRPSLLPLQDFLDTLTEYAACAALPNLTFSLPPPPLPPPTPPLSPQ